MIAADRIVYLTLAEARALPNLLGRVAAAMLAAHGTYTATVNGVRTQYVLVADGERSA